MSAKSPERIPDIVLERHRLNELPPDDARGLEEQIRRDPALQRRIEALDRSDQEIRRQYPADMIADRVRQRAKAPAGATKRSAYWIGALAAAAAALLLFAIAPRRTAEAPTLDDGSDRLKGLTPSLTLYRQTVSGSETLADGAVARPGDLVRVGYRAAGKSYGVILSIDGRGGVTVHLPPAGDRASALKHDGTALLDQAYELDDAPQWERFYFVTGDAPFAVAPVVEAARRAAGGLGAASLRLVLPHGLDQSTFLLQKEARP